MLAASIVQDMFVGEAGEGEPGRRSGEDWRLLLYTYENLDLDDEGGGLASLDRL